MELREHLARVLYNWMPVVGPGGHGTVSFDAAREQHPDFIDKHFEEADDLIASMIAWTPTPAMIEVAGDVHGSTPWSASDDSVYTSLFRAMLQAKTPTVSQAQGQQNEGAES